VDQVLVINNTGALDKRIKYPSGRIMLNISGVQSATIADHLPTETSYNQNGWFKDASLDAKTGQHYDRFLC
jgi:hypothetical protein